MEFLGQSYILENSYSPVVHNKNKNLYRKSQDKVTILNIMRKSKLMNTTQHVQMQAYHNNNTKSSTG
jgi:hypothetical protein